MVCNATYSSTEDGKIYRARLWQTTVGTGGGGTVLDEAFAISGVASGSITVRTDTVRHFSASDVIMMGLFHNQAGNATMEGGTDYKSYFECYLIAKD